MVKIDGSGHGIVVGVREIELTNGRAVGSRVDSCIEFLLRPRSRDRRILSITSTANPRSRGVERVLCVRGANLIEGSTGRPVV